MGPIEPADRVVLVVGGGHAGLLLALGLARLGLEVRVIDAQPPETVLHAPFGGRALALMYGSQRVLEGLGVWPALAGIAEPVWSVRVEDRATGATVSYDAAEVAEHPFAFGIENRALRAGLLGLVSATAGIEVVAPARVVRLSRIGCSAEVTLDDGCTIRASLIVGADGRGSTVRRLAGLNGEHRRYRQSALTFAVRHGAPHGHQVREYLRPPGPLALLPIGLDRSSVTWVEPSGPAEQMAGDDPEALALLLNEQIGDVLGPLEVIGEPGVQPLSAHLARRFTAPRIALIGDAAHGIHPIHAQGFNLAVRDVAALLEVVADTARSGRDLGSAEALCRYERWRRADARLVGGLTDSLNRLFSNDLGPAKAVRLAGLTALDRLAPLKHFAMRRGMGLTGDLPKLARGEAL